MYFRVTCIRLIQDGSVVRSSCFIVFQFPYFPLKYFNYVCISYFSVAVMKQKGGVYFDSRV